MEQQTKTQTRARPKKGEPKFDPKKSVPENVYRMKHAGLTWSRIEELCGLGPWGGPRAYKQACAERDEKPKDFRKKNDRASAPAKKATKKATTKKASEAQS